MLNFLTINIKTSSFCKFTLFIIVDSLRNLVLPECQKLTINYTSFIINTY